MKTLSTFTALLSGRPGRLVRTYPAGTTSYDVRTLPAGSYLVEIDQDAGILRRRLQLTR